MIRWPWISINDFLFIMVKMTILNTTGYADVPIIPGRPQ